MLNTSRLTQTASKNKRPSEAFNLLRLFNSHGMLKDEAQLTEIERISAAIAKTDGTDLDLVHLSEALQYESLSGLRTCFRTNEYAGCRERAAQVLNNLELAGA